MDATALQQERPERIPFTRLVRVAPVDGAWPAIRTISSNLSLSGMFVRSATTLPPGTRVALTFEAKGQDLPFAEAEVAWERDNPHPEGDLPGFGLRFTEYVHQRAADLVTELVERRVGLEEPQPIPLFDLAPAPLAASSDDELEVIDFDESVIEITDQLEDLGTDPQAELLSLDPQATLSADPDGLTTELLPLPELESSWSDDLPVEAIEEEEEAPARLVATRREIADFSLAAEHSPAKASRFSLLEPAEALELTSAPGPLWAEAPSLDGAQPSDEDLDLVAEAAFATYASVRPAAQPKPAVSAQRQLAQSVLKYRKPVMASAVALLVGIPIGLAVMAWQTSAPTPELEAPVPAQAQAQAQAVPPAPQPESVNLPVGLSVSSTGVTLTARVPQEAPVAVEPTPEPVAAAPVILEAPIEPVPLIPALARAPSAPATKPAPASDPAPKESRTAGARTLSLGVPAVPSLSVRGENNSLEIRPKLGAGASLRKVFTLSGPDRLVMDIGGPTPARSHKLSVNGKSVKDVRVGPMPEGVRVVLDLRRKIASFKRSGDSVEVVFR